MAYVRDNILTGAIKGNYSDVFIKYFRQNNTNQDSINDYIYLAAEYNNQNILSVLSNNQFNQTGLVFMGYVMGNHLNNAKKEWNKLSDKIKKEIINYDGFPKNFMHFYFKRIIVMKLVKTDYVDSFIYITKLLNINKYIIEDALNDYDYTFKSLFNVTKVMEYIISKYDHLVYNIYNLGMYLLIEFNNFNFLGDLLNKYSTKLVKYYKSNNNDRTKKIITDMILHDELPYKHEGKTQRDTCGYKWLQTQI